MDRKFASEISKMLLEDGEELHVQLFLTDGAEYLIKSLTIYPNELGTDWYCLFQEVKKGGYVNCRLPDVHHIYVKSTKSRQMGFQLDALDRLQVELMKRARGRLADGKLPGVSEAVPPSP